MKYVQGFNRHQAVLFPTCIDELITDDAEVRVIDILVDALQVEKFGFLVFEPLEEGRPRYHPRDLFKLYLYGYLNRVRSSRMLARECTRNVEVIWLLRGLQPCFRTIAGFRSEYPDAFRFAFRYLVEQMSQKNLFGRKSVAIDGSKFRAVNSKKNNYNQKKIDRHLTYIDERIQDFMQELQNSDLSETRQEEVRENYIHHRSRSPQYGDPWPGGRGSLQCPDRSR